MAIQILCLIARSFHALKSGAYASFHVPTWGKQRTCRSWGFCKQDLQKERDAKRRTNSSSTLTIWACTQRRSTRRSSIALEHHEVLLPGLLIARNPFGQSFLGPEILLIRIGSLYALPPTLSILGGNSNC